MPTVSATMFSSQKVNTIMWLKVEVTWYAAACVGGDDRWFAKWPVTRWWFSIQCIVCVEILLCWSCREFITWPRAAFVEPISAQLFTKGSFDAQTAIRLTSRRQVRCYEFLIKGASLRRLASAVFFVAIFPVEQFAEIWAPGYLISNSFPAPVG